MKYMPRQYRRKKKIIKHRAESRHAGGRPDERGRACGDIRRLAIRLGSLFLPVRVIRAEQNRQDAFAEVGPVEIDKKALPEERLFRFVVRPAVRVVRQRH